MVDEARTSPLNSHPHDPTGMAVVYWMQRDQRSEDNWALIRAIEIANKHNVPLVVTFFLSARIGSGIARHYDFMLRGLFETAQKLRDQGIGFELHSAATVKGVVSKLTSYRPVAVVTDQDYLHGAVLRRTAVAGALDVSFEVVDANATVPPRFLYPKLAFGAYILRPKLKAARERFVVEYPEPVVTRRWPQDAQTFQSEAAVEQLIGEVAGESVIGPVGLESGPTAALKRFDEFLATGFGVYATGRNDPTQAATSRLSAYLHFGHISAGRIAFDVLASPQYVADPDAAEGFLDELVTWRETAINNAVYNPYYRSYEGIPAWARESLESHADDPREFIYTEDELERGQTHDELWNAAQREMVRTGRMHGYMRMYWAKKILEWTGHPREAISIAVRLNDRYFLDGRDPNGYAGILWAIGGLHDRPWFDRPIYGKIRYMSASGAKSKFDTAAYIAWTKTL